MTEDAGRWTTGTADSPQGPEHAARQALRVRTWAPPSVATLLMVTLGLAAASWVLAIQLMRGMDPDVAPETGSFAFFMILWVTMMAAMTLPGAIPAVLRGVRATGRLSAGACFVASYLAVWALVGVAVYPLNPATRDARRGGARDPCWDLRAHTAQTVRPPGNVARACTLRFSTVSRASARASDRC